MLKTRPYNIVKEVNLSSFITRRGVCVFVVNLIMPNLTMLSVTRPKTCRWLVDNKCERSRRERLWPILRNYAIMYLDRLSDISHTRGVLSQDRDLNLRKSKYEAKVLTGGLPPYVTTILNKTRLTEEHDSVENFCPYWNQR